MLTARPGEAGPWLSRQAAPLAELNFRPRMSAPANVTQLLVAWSGGDQAALEALTPLVHQELHRLAARYMAGERPGHILQATALVNEAYLRLVDWKDVRWQNRAHFFGMAAQIMRRVLVDVARTRDRAKRGGGAAARLAVGSRADCPRPRASISWRWMTR